MSDPVEILHVSVAPHRQPGLLDLRAGDCRVGQVEHRVLATAIEVVQFPEDRGVDYAGRPLSERAYDGVKPSLRDRLLSSRGVACMRSTNTWTSTSSMRLRRP
jgi:hypothetical protein